MTTRPPTLSVQMVTFADHPQPSWTALFDHARAADQAGVDRLIVSDHVAFGPDLSAYSDPRAGGTEGGRQPTGPDGHWLEPLTTLSFIAARTASIRLQTGILLAALRRPVVLAKTAATLDVLSGGRLDLGVGVGWQRAEYEAAGLGFEGRGRLLDHTLEVCEELWSHRPASYRSAELEFQDIHAMPQPTQPGGLPVWVSGRINQAVLRRLARFGHGWIPWGDDARDPAIAIPRIEQACAAIGRTTPVEIQGTLPIARDAGGEIELEATMAGVPALVDAGITDFKAFLRLSGSLDEAVATLEPLVDAFRATVGRK